MITRAFVFSAFSPGNHSQDLEKRFRVLKMLLPMTRFLVSGEPDQSGSEEGKKQIQHVTKKTTP